MSLIHNLHTNDKRGVTLIQTYNHAQARILHFSVCSTPLGQLLFNTGHAWILIERINFAVLADVFMLIVCLVGFIHLRFSEALRTMMVTVQHSVQGKHKSWLKVYINFAALTDVLMLIVCLAKLIHLRSSLALIAMLMIVNCCSVQGKNESWVKALTLLFLLMF